ncbi:PEGA domain-containing protein [Methanorbis furvi]
MRKSMIAALALLLILLVFALPASAAEGETGALSVVSSPSGADVYVGDMYVGQTNNAFVNILQGTYTVRVVKAGYNVYVVENVYIPGGSSANTVPMSADLQKSVNMGGLIVDSSPTGASVYVDDVFCGTTHYGGLQIADLIPGTHTIRFELAGYKPYTVTDYNTPAGYGTPLTNVNLVPIATPTPTQTSSGPATTASMMLDSSPSGATVSVNNEFRGYTPLTLSGFVPGSYSVLISHDGYMAWQSTMTVSAGETVRQTAYLNPASAVPTPTQSPAGVVPIFAGVLAVAGCLIFFRR